MRGATLSRPAFNELGRLPVQHVIPFVQDRICRADALDTVNWIRRLQDSGKTVHLTDVGGVDTYDLLSTMGLMLRADASATEREKIKERTSGQTEQSGKVVIAARVTYGYTYDRAAGMLVINEIEAVVVRQIFDWYNKERIGIRIIAGRLSDAGIHTSGDYQKKRRNTGVWSSAVINKILHNETYAGVWYYGFHSKVKVELIPVPVPAIVSRETFDAAQRQSAANATNARRNVKLEYLFRGRLRCPDCGMIYSCYSDRKFPNVVRYQCPGQDLTHSRDGKSAMCHGTVPRDVIDAAGWDTICFALKNPETLLTNLKAERDALKAATQPDREYLQQMHADLDKIDARIGKLLPLYLDGDWSRVDLDEQKSVLNKRRKDIVAKIAELEERLSAVSAEVLSESQIMELIHDVRRDIDTNTFAKRRATIEKLDAGAIVKRNGDGTFTMTLSIKIGRDVHSNLSSQHGKIGLGT